MGMAECVLQGPGNFKTFHDRLLTTSPGFDGISRPFVTTSTPPPPPYDGILFQDLS